LWDSCVGGGWYFLYYSYHRNPTGKEFFYSRWNLIAVKLLRRNLQNSSIGFQFECLAFLAWLIANHGILRVQKNPSEKRATTLPENASVWINWYWHNQD
jgi:hypothetical protein